MDTSERTITEGGGGKLSVKYLMHIVDIISRLHTCTQHVGFYPLSSNPFRRRCHVLQKISETLLRTRCTYAFIKTLNIAVLPSTQQCACPSYVVAARVAYNFLEMTSLRPFTAGVGSCLIKDFSPIILSPSTTTATSFDI